MLDPNAPCLDGNLDLFGSPENSSIGHDANVTLMSRMSRRRSWLVNLKDRCAQLDEWFEEPRIIPKAMAHMAHMAPWPVDSFDKVIEIWDINEISMKYLEISGNI